MVAPVAPSTPMSFVPFMNQTMGWLCPSVVVTIGAAGNPRLALLVATHHETVGCGGLPGGIRTDMTTLPLAPPAGHWPPLLVVRITCAPCASVYAAGAVWTIMAPLAATVSCASWPPIPPRLWASRT